MKMRLILLFCLASVMGWCQFPPPLTRGPWTTNVIATNGIAWYPLINNGTNYNLYLTNNYTSGVASGLFAYDNTNLIFSASDLARNPISTHAPNPIYQTTFPGATNPSGWTFNGAWTVTTNGLRTPATGDWNTWAVWDQHTTPDDAEVSIDLSLITTNTAVGVCRRDSSLGLVGVVGIMDASNRLAILYGTWDGLTIPGVSITNALAWTFTTNTVYRLSLYKTDSEHIQFTVTDTVTGNSVSTNTTSGNWNALDGPGVVSLFGQSDIRQLTYLTHKSRTPKVLILGDSFIEGDSLVGAKDSRFAALMRDWIGGDCVIAGMGGESTATIQTRLPIDLKKYNPAYTMVLLQNDATYAAFTNGIVPIIQDIKKQGSVPVLFTLSAPGVAGTAIWDTVAKHAMLLNSTLWVLTNAVNYGYRVVDMNAAVTTGNLRVDLNPAFDNGDGVHLNVAGHAAVWAQMKRDIGDILGTEQQRMNRFAGGEPTTVIPGSMTIGRNTGAPSIKGTTAQLIIDNTNGVVSLQHYNLLTTFLGQGGGRVLEGSWISTSPTTQFGMLGNGLYTDIFRIEMPENTTLMAMSTNGTLTVNGTNTYLGTNVYAAGLPLATKEWVAEQLGSGFLYFTSTNIAADPGFATTNVYNFVNNVIPVYDSRTYSAVTNNQYIGSSITTNKVLTLSAPATINMYLSRSGGSSLVVQPEIYYTYDRTNLLGDFATENKTITTGTNLYTWTCSFPTVEATNTDGFYVVRRLKVMSQTGTPDIKIHLGTNYASHVDLKVSTSLSGFAAVSVPNTFAASNQFNSAISAGSIYVTNFYLVSGGTFTSGGSAGTDGQVLTGNTGDMPIWTDATGAGVVVWSSGATVTNFTMAGQSYVSGNMGATYAAGDTNVLDLNYATRTITVTNAITFAHATNGEANTHKSTVIWFVAGGAGPYTLTLPAWRTNLAQTVCAAITNGVMTKMIVESLGTCATSATQTNIYCSFEYFK